jgi:hypothetical protein
MSSERLAPLRNDFILKMRLGLDGGQTEFNKKSPEEGFASSKASRDQYSVTPPFHFTHRKVKGVVLMGLLSG